jgi:hypothetical protein
MPDGEHTEPAAQEVSDDVDDDAGPDSAETESSKTESSTTESSKKKSADPKPAKPESSGGESSSGALFSNYGIASTFLAALSVAVVALGVVIWHAHRNDMAERSYLTRVMQTAVDWTGVLINMNTGNIDASLQRLHDGTVGELNTDFDAAVQPYRQVVEKLQLKSAGQIESVAIETVHHDLDTQPGASRPVVTTKLPPFATRTDSVMVVATSVSENVGAKPQMVHWNLRLEVSNVDGKLMISKLESIR